MLKWYFIRSISLIFCETWQRHSDECIRFLCICDAVYRVLLWFLPGNEVHICCYLRQRATVFQSEETSLWLRYDIERCLITVKTTMHLFSFLNDIWKCSLCDYKQLRIKWLINIVSICEYAIHFLDTNRSVLISQATDWMKHLKTQLKYKSC